MLDIAVYSMNYSPGILREIPYVAYFVERGLVHLDALRPPHGRMVFVAASPLDPEILAYHLREVCGMTAREEARARERFVALTVPPPEGSSLAEALCRDARAMDALGREVARADATRLHVFAADAHSEELGRRLGVPPSEPSAELALRWGSKAGGKDVFRRAGVPTARGEPSLHRSLDEVVAAAFRLVRGSRPPARIVVKLNAASWGDGIGNAVVDSARLRRTGDISRSIDTILQSWSDFEPEIARDGAIVEEYLPDVTCSPSGQGIIEGDGTVRTVSTHQQHVRAGQYVGCEFPAPSRFVDQIRDGVERTGRVLRDEGMRGSFGVDFVGLADGSLHAVEINARKVAPSHVLSFTEMAARTRLGAAGRTSGGPVRYVHRRLCAPELRDLRPGEAVAALRRRGLLYDRATGAGVLLHILSGLEPCGYVEVTAVQRDRDRATALVSSAEAELLEAAGRGRQNG